MGAENGSTRWPSVPVALLCAAMVALGARTAAAHGPGDGDGAPPAPRPVLHVTFAPATPPHTRSCFDALRFDVAPAPAARAPLSFSGGIAGALAATPDGGQAPAPRPRAFVYSDAYQTRAKIHRVASYAMLPLFGVEAYLGQTMFNDPAKATAGRRNAHRAIGAAIGGLFGVNSVTGVWNLIEGRKDPNAGMRRVIHGVLMLVADGGFLATALTRPRSSTAAQIAIYDAKKNQHLALAYASVSVATVGYLIMLFK